MRIVITGSLGHISKPLAITLIAQGHQVIVISSKAAKRKSIEDLGALPAIGSIEDVDFLSATFAGADAVYCMVPPADNKEPDRRIYYSRIAKFYSQALKETKVNRVIHLSTFGADLNKGTGILLGAHDAEHIFNALENITLTHIRPTYFYYNLLNFIASIKFKGAMHANYGGNRKFPMVAPTDIAEAIADELLHVHNEIRYVSSDEKTGNEIASILGAAIGKPELKWNMISNDEAQTNLESFGVPTQLAQGLVEMYDSMYKGDLASDFYRNQPTKWGKLKLEEYAKEFSIIYNS